MQTEMDFILGRKSFDEWDSYIDELLTKLGGQDIIASYEEQLKEFGLI